MNGDINFVPLAPLPQDDGVFCRGSLRLPLALLQIVVRELSEQIKIESFDEVACGEIQVYAARLISIANGGHNDHVNDCREWSADDREWMADDREWTASTASTTTSKNHASLTKPCAASLQPTAFGPRQSPPKSSESPTCTPSAAVWTSEGSPPSSPGALKHSAKRVRSKCSPHSETLKDDSLSGTPKWMQSLEDVFRQLDANGSGSVVRDELREALQAAGVPKARAQMILPFDGGDVVDLSEWKTVIDKVSCDKANSEDKLVKVDKVDSKKALKAMSVTFEEPPSPTPDGSQSVALFDPFGQKAVRNMILQRSSTASTKDSWLKRAPTQDSQMDLIASVSAFVGKSRASFFHLPPWVRFAEEVLRYHYSRLSILHQYWSDAIDGQNLNLNDVVMATQKASFSVRIMVEYDHVCDQMFATQRNSIISSAQVWSPMAFAGAFLAGVLAVASAFPLHPSSRTRLAWDAISFSICFYDAIVLPMFVFDFDDHAQAIKDKVDLAGACFWSADLFLSFVTGYMDGPICVRSFKKIAITYIRTWLVLDAAIVLNDWGSVILTSHYKGTDIIGVTKILKSIIRCVKITRVWKIGSHMSASLRLVNSEITLACVKIFAQALLVVVACHYIACGWYALYRYSAFPRTWVDDFRSPDDTMTYIYFTSLHWALTQLLPASITVQPVNVSERVYNIIVIIFSMVCFSSFISSITVSMNDVRQCRSKAILRDHELRRFLKDHEISSDVGHAIWSFIRKRPLTDRSALRPAEVTALKCLPANILEHVYEDAYLKIMKAHSLFDFYSRIEPRCMAKLCKAGVEQRTLSSCEMLWHDLLAYSMLFVRRGTLTYKDDNLGFEKLLEPYDWCCEEALWGGTPTIGAPFFAGVTGCELLMVNPDVFRQVAKEYSSHSNSFIFLARYGQEFIRRFNSASYDCECTDILFNNQNAVVDVLKRAVNVFRSAAGSNEEDDDTDESPTSPGSASVDSMFGSPRARPTASA